MLNRYSHTVYQVQRCRVMQGYIVAALAICIVMLFLPNSAMANAKLPGGDGSVEYQPFASYLLPMANMSEDAKTDFHAARALAHQPWVKAPASTTARDGLGPIYNARSCLACHINGGRGLMPNDGKQRLTQGVVRLSVEDEKGVRAHPVYGEQLQTQSIALAHQLNLAASLYKSEPKPEAYAYIDWQYKQYVYADGSKVELRHPKLRLQRLAYGELGEKVRLSLRNAPPIHGVGLLEMISEKDILANQKQQADQGLVSGKVNRVFDPQSAQTVIGRFGWKANQPSVLVQTAQAFQQDIGISNPLFTDQPCTRYEKECRQQPLGYVRNSKEPFELNNRLLQAVADFSKNLAVPKARQMGKTLSVQGDKLFKQTGCIACHKASYVTTEDKQFPQLSNQQIWPYSDLLVHDMGEALADNRSDFLAGGREWRTAPLWGIGLSERVNGSHNFLHDGRARTIEEAILWHGGEAEFSKQNFVKLTQQQRQLLLDFIKAI
ncbi:di-heme oxidoredictase family protein [Thiomicrorhabdus sediminis]|uniref:Cytochrome c domain-containing protein n=1 Tax=Thiomicrorhabdus sediminis TaxID=2580412 RepID=A0A4P9K328_9GAMM|nr:di-heme oxidoredictase family protein [Thiomicrorhabdus sediminis]QCU89239.1 hypothetical protein FE785_00640 [Thiomicrorhabdus sediminis]